MNNSKSSLFLMELIIAILFFSLSSAVCVQLFVRSHEIDQETTYETHASMAMQNISEVFYSVSGSSEAMVESLDGAVHAAAKDNVKNTSASEGSTSSASSVNDLVYIFYDSDWNPVSCDSLTEGSLEKISYIATVLFSVTSDAAQSGQCISADICIYSLDSISETIPDMADPSFDFSDKNSIVEYYDKICTCDPILSQSLTTYIQYRKGAD